MPRARFTVCTLMAAVFIIALAFGLVRTWQRGAARMGPTDPTVAAVFARRDAQRSHVPPTTADPALFLASAGAVLGSLVLRRLIIPRPVATGRVAASRPDPPSEGGAGPGRRGV